MERKQESSKGVSNITINDDESLDLCVLKRDIASHSLFKLLVQSHFSCFKLFLGNEENIENEILISLSAAAEEQRANLFTTDQSELDQFMEAYCERLKKLKEEMEETQQESMAFISLMYSELDDDHPPLHIPPSNIPTPPEEAGGRES